MPDAPAAEVRQACRAFGGVQALREVDLMVRPGEVHALIGENGAGKSTLVKVLAGALAIDSGEALVAGQALRPNPRHARQLGVRCIHQARMLVPNLTVAENLSLFERRRPARHRRDDRRAARAALDRIGLESIDVDQLVTGLEPGEAQLVEIARELSGDAALVIMDEPTAALSSWEAHRLLDTIRQLRSMGTAVIVVSHDLDEILAVADQVTVLRDGSVTLRSVAAGLDHDRLVGAMLGATLVAEKRHPTPAPSSGAPVLELVSASSSQLRSVDVAVHAGEVVGVTGILGSGIDEVARLAVGLDQPVEGAVDLDGRPAKLMTRRAAARAGIGYVPSDRLREGVFPAMVATQQLNLSRIALTPGRVWINRRRERRVVATTAMAVSLPPGMLDRPASALSGGNQQKVVVARVLRAEPRVLVVHEPTSGVDVGARAAIHQHLRSLATAGRAVLLVSSDMAEVATVADRVIVIRRGRVVYAGTPLDEARLAELAMGGSRGDA